MELIRRDILFKDQQTEELLEYTHINQNEFSHRKHKRQKEEDIAVCVCKYDGSALDSACGERCLNVLTSSECTPGYCPIGVYCRNQRFQKCQNAKIKLFRTEGRGWGILADENIKAGWFIIEYCGEVISWKEARQRSQTYESLGLKDAYIISLNGLEYIDATKKGSHARFINHSCQPNCETRKWTVMGEVRVGVFAKQDISVGTELVYDYNFEWYGGDKVRCLCGAPNCSEFLGAKSRGFQEDTYLWEDNDDRYTIEKIPLYDSAEDDLPAKKLHKSRDFTEPNFTINGKFEPIMVDARMRSEQEFESTASVIESLDSVSMDRAIVNAMKEENDQTKLYRQDNELSLSQNNATISRIRSNSANKRSPHYSNGKSKHLAQVEVDVKFITKLLTSKDAQEEVVKYEEVKNQATTKLCCMYNEIRPAIEEHERDSQDSVPTSAAEKWIEACCFKLKSDFDLHSSIIKNLTFQKTRGEGENSSQLKYLTF